MKLLLPALSEIATIALILAIVLGAQVAGCVVMWFINVLVPKWHRTISHLRREFAALEKTVSGKSPADARANGSVDIPIPGRLRRTLRIALVAGLALTVSGLAAVQFFFFDDAVHLAFARAESNSGIAFEFDSAEGNLFTGEARLTNLRIKRNVHPACKFDVAVRETGFDLDLLSLFTGELSFSEVQLTGVSGSYRRTAAPIDKPPRWPFEIRRLDMTDVSLLVSDQSREPALIDLPLLISRSTAINLRSNWAANDVLFHTNATGTFNGDPLQLRSTGDNFHYRFAWDAPQMSVGLLASFFGEFWNVFETGDATVHVEGVTSPESVMMDVSIDADGLKLRPKVASAMAAENVDALIRKCVEHEDGKLKLALAFKMDKRPLQYQLSPEAAPVWTLLAEAVTDRQADLCGVTPDSLRESGRRALKQPAAFQSNPEPVNNH